MGRVLIEFLVFVVCLLVSSTRGNRGQPCGSYGCPYRPRYEPFVPAPPGQTPRCAKPGQTFCEVPDHYPQQLIKFLVDKCSYDFASVLRDEAHFDFDTYTSKPEYDQGYEYPRQQVPQFYPEALPVMTPSSVPQYPAVHQGQPAIVYGPPSNDTDREGYNYDPPVRSQRNSYVQETTTSTLLNSQKNLRNFHNARAYENLQIDSPNQEQQELWSNRYSRDSSNGSSRPRRDNPFVEFTITERARKKRQAGSPDAVPLCRTDSRYISPRAALNSQGNWMYVVNLSETREKYTQLVRSEACSTTECSGLCSLPDGYKSNCKQKYVQRRLVALEGTGDRLYTDVFWFPHGCACEVSSNF
ncbi:protein spaetzle 5 isoform X2 [Venturia canescens]|uniref:protein spaetzle 5 isoform X2 n=1 Tax=Venturia canescens TaxID=32260 RepID=UPI001C9C9F73|nr:protein spaetzle 5 isoform X2 [Venturia canescens]